MKTTGKDPILDLSELEPLFDPSTLKKVLEKLSVSLSESRVQLQAKAADQSALRAEVHTLKGLAGYCGGYDVVSACLAIEMSTERNPEAVAALLRPLNKAIEKLTDKITAYISTPTFTSQDP